MVQLVYGLKDNKLYHVDQVENGEKCGCVCPNCGDILIAKQGEINDHHFAHKAKECDITYAQETILHLMAKEVLSKCRTFLLPPVTLEDRFAFFSKDEYSKLKSTNNVDDLYYKYTKYKRILTLVDNVIVEKYLDNIKPDIILEIGETRLVVEIAVTHFIDRKKKEKIFDKQQLTIEIDLSEYKDKINEITEVKLRDILLNNMDSKKWIYYDKIHKDIEEVQNKNKFILSKQDEVKQYWIKNFSKEYRDKYEEYNRDNKNKYLGNYWSKQWISQTTPIPWFADYPINGDVLLNGDRRRWQGMIISKLYYSKRPLSSEDIVKYITDFDFLKIKDRFTFYFTFNDRQKICMNKTNRYQVVRDYYKFLQDNQIIDENGKFIYKF
jgi:hypothetical protein